MYPDQFVDETERRVVVTSFVCVYVCMFVCVCVLYVYERERVRARMSCLRAWAHEDNRGQLTALKALTSFMASAGPYLSRTSLIDSLTATVTWCSPCFATGITSKRFHKQASERGGVNGGGEGGRERECDDSKCITCIYHAHRPGRSGQR